MKKKSLSSVHLPLSFFVFPRPQTNDHLPRRFMYREKFSESGVCQNHRPCVKKKKKYAAYAFYDGLPRKKRGQTMLSVS